MTRVKTKVKGKAKSSKRKINQTKIIAEPGKIEFFIVREVNAHR